MAAKLPEGRADFYGDQHQYARIIREGAVPSFADLPYSLAPRLANMSENALRSIAIPEELVRQDLETAVRRAACPFVLLFDECDVFANERALLELMRSVLANVLGMQLIVAGTPTLFEAVDELFSPLTRQFKRIVLGPLSSDADINACVTSPLKHLDPAIASRLYPTPNPMATEIAKLTGGNPYEIRLLCHFMFKAAQQRNRPYLTLDLGVIDGVRGELAAGHNLKTRPIMAAVHEYSATQLHHLALCLKGDGAATLDQLGLIQDIATEVADDRLLVESFRRFHEDLLYKGVGGKLKFAGDELDRIYIKYFARTKNVQIPDGSASFGALTRLEVEKCLVAHGIKPIIVAGEAAAGRIDVGAASFDAITGLIESPEDMVGLSSGPFGAACVLAYGRLMNHLRQKSLKIFRVVGSFETQWAQIPLLYFFSERVQPEVLTSLVDEINERIGNRDSRIYLETDELIIESVVEHVEKIAPRFEKPMRGIFSALHILSLFSLHRNEDLEVSRTVSEIASKWDSERTRVPCGYIRLLQRDFEASREILEPALEVNDAETQTLAAIDLGVIAAIKGDVDRALKLFEKAQLSAKAAGKIEKAYLTVPALKDGKLDFVEEHPADVEDTIRRWQSILTGSSRDKDKSVGALVVVSREEAPT
ncbi:MAG: hypothetical protein ABSE64_06015 [Vulcanimicrobiaceae bacterium]